MHQYYQNQEIRSSATCVSFSLFNSVINEKIVKMHSGLYHQIDIIKFI